MFAFAFDALLLLITEQNNTNQGLVMTVSIGFLSGFNETCVVVLVKSSWSI